MTCAATKGTINTRPILSNRNAGFTEPDAPKKSSKNTGNKITCKIRFRGSTEALSVVFPFAIPVKIRYQSVQGGYHQHDKTYPKA